MLALQLQPIESPKGPQQFLGETQRVPFVSTEFLSKEFLRPRKSKFGEIKCKARFVAL